MNANRLLTFIGSMTALASFAATDLATYWDTPPTSRQFLNAAFTLSTDYAFGTGGYVTFKNGASFDFSESNAKLMVDSMQYMDEGSGNPWFKGGTWDCRGGGITFGDWSNLPHNNRTVSFDNVCLTNIMRMLGPYSCRTDNFVLRLTNHSVLCCNDPNVSDDSKHYSTFRQSQDDTGKVGPCLFEISSASRFYSAGDFLSDRDTKVIKTNSQNTTFLVTGEGSTFVANKDFYLGNEAGGFELDVLDGASFSVANNFYSANSSGTGGSNTVQVGSGSCLEVGRYFYMGYNPSLAGNAIVVSNGTLSCGIELYVGYHSSGNSLRILDGGQVSAGGVVLGYGENAGENSLFAGPGTTVTTSSGGISIGSFAGSDHDRVHLMGATWNAPTAPVLYIGAKGTSGHEFIASNATMNISNAIVGYANGSSNNLFRIQGGDSVVGFPTTLDWDPFGAGGRLNTVELLDGAELSLKNVYAGGISNVFRLAGGAKLTATESFNLKMSNAKGAAPSVGNRVEISDGSVLTLQSSFANAGTNCTLVIDDSTLYYSSGYGFHFTKESKGGQCIFRGEHPKAHPRSGAEATAFPSIRSDAVVTWELPTNGTVYAEAPLKGLRAQFIGNSSIRIDNLEAFRAALTERVNVPLVETTSDDEDKKARTDMKTVVKNAQASLPKWAKLKFSDDGKMLYLCVRPERGFSIVIR